MYRCILIAANIRLLELNPYFQIALKKYTYNKSVILSEFGKNAV